MVGGTHWVLGDDISIAELAEDISALGLLGLQGPSYFGSKDFHHSLCLIYALDWFPCWFIPLMLQCYDQRFDLFT